MTGFAVAAFGLGEDDAPVIQAPCNAVASPVHDPGARVFCDSGTGEVLADGAAWDRATDADRDRARARLAAVRRSEDLHAAGVRRADADAAAAAEASVTVSAVAKWRRRVRGLPEGSRVAALLDGDRTGRPSPIDGNAAWRGTLEALAFHHGPHLTAEHARRTLIARHGGAPSLRAVRRWLARWRDEHARTLSAVTSPDRHRSHRQPAFGSSIPDGAVALWELDSTVADVMCADGRRPALVAALDVGTRRLAVHVARSSSAEAIAALLRRCLLDWGVPAAIRTDEGADYTSGRIAGVLADLEIAHRIAPPYTPEAKGAVERALGTLSRDLLAHLPGFCGHHPGQAAAIRSRRSFAGRRGMGPAAQMGATLTVPALQSRIDSWCADVYGRRAHAGLGGRSPWEAARAAPPLRRVTDERALDALLAEPAGGGTRRVGKRGVRVGGRDYIAPELGARVGDTVRVRFDPAPGRLHVYGADGRYICIAVDPSVTGADRAAVAAGARAAARAADTAARAAARELAALHRPEGAMDDVLAHAQAEAGRVVALPRRGAAHETPALREAARAADAAARATASETSAPAVAPVRAGGSRALAAARRLYLEDET